MLGQVFAAFGGLLGKMAGGGIISTVLKFAGKMLGNYLAQKSYNPTEYNHYGNIIDNITVVSDTNGQVMPLVFGKMRIDARIIWALNLKEVAIKDTQARYFRNSSCIKSLHHSTEYIYYADFALGICEGIVEKFDRVWIGDKESDISGYKFRFYKGDEEQEPDPFIEYHQGIGKTPAFRGLCYIIFENFPLSNFGNKIPHFSFEITRRPQNNNIFLNDGMIENIVIIPGSGEFVYDTKLQEKITYSSKNNIELYREYINCHNSKHLADSVYNLDELQSLCSNLEWAAPVVCWFADSLDAAKANIFPTVEYNDSQVKTLDEWNVAGISRDRARIISRDEDSIPNYGGTVNDASLIRYLEILKARKLKIMLYPMIFLDIPGKPWRGHITSSSDGIRRFFNHPQGYKNFILHYARLACGKVDAFIIGSEFKAMTKVKEGDNFPAVEELIDLAHKVKSILGPNVIVTYAADWSEYHHTEGGIYNLDPLWTCSAIDIVAIDAYFPLTNSNHSNIDIADIKAGWESGEGWDYYIDGQDKKPLNSEWAWKNIEYWWKNYHINSDGTKSPWIPKLKKIWFTEFGFPSIDKGPNQPNIFYDPRCRDGGVPKYSNGGVDFAIQKKSIKATIDFWKNSEFVERIFLWAWDARPYPAWPHGKIWRDSNLWLKGHWVNGKLCGNSLANILVELCARACIDPKNIYTETIDDHVEGMVLDSQSSIWDVINCLRLGYFFDIKNDYLKNLEFIKRGSIASISLDSRNIVKNKKIIDIEEITSQETISEINISFKDNSNDYNHNIVTYKSDHSSNMPIYYLNFPVTMDDATALNIAEKIIHSEKYENRILRFTVLITDIFKVSVSSIISVQLLDNQYKIRVTDIRYENLLCHVTGMFTYDFVYNRFKRLVQNPAISVPYTKIEFIVFELPISLKGKYGNSIYAASSKQSSLYSILGDKIKIADLKESNIGTVIELNLNSNANSFVIDAISKPIIYSSKPLLAGGCALIGEEVICFSFIEKISENTYSLGRLIRGCFHTEQHIHNHVVGEKFILLDNVSEISVSDIAPKSELKFTANSIQKSYVYEAVAERSLQVSDLNIRDNIITWVGKAKYIDYWRCIDSALEYLVLVESESKIEEFRTKKENFSLNDISAVKAISIIAIQKGLERSEPSELAFLA